MGLLAVLTNLSVKLKTFFTKIFSKSSGEEAPAPEPTIDAFVLGEMGGDEDERKEDDDDKREDDDDKEQKKEDDEGPLTARWGLRNRRRQITEEDLRANALLDSIGFLPTLKATNAPSLRSLAEEEEEEEDEKQRGRSGRRHGAVVRDEGER